MVIVLSYLGSTLFSLNPATLMLHGALPSLVGFALLRDASLGPWVEGGHQPPPQKEKSFSPLAKSIISIFCIKQIG